MAVLAVLLLAGCDFKGGEETRRSGASQPPPVKPRSNVRVLLQENRKELIVSCAAPGRLSLPLRAEGQAAVTDAQTGQVLYPLTPGVFYQIARQYGSWSLTRLDNKEWQVFSATRLEIRPGQNLAIGFKLDPKDPATAPYRGAMRLIPATSDLFHVINDLNVEEYLLGVVGAEAYAHWHIAALQAQCVAARTYALYWLNRRGTTENWDVRATQASQMYKGIGAENDRIAQAVRDTGGIVLAYGPAGKEKIFPAYYSAICGGHTQDARLVFGESLKPLAGTDCPYCQTIAPADLLTWKEVRIPKSRAAELLMANYQFLNDLIKIVDIKITASNAQGRAQFVTLTGLEGRTQRIRAEDFRLTLDPTGRALQSSWYQFADLGDSWGFSQGRGWGHGVGMCQWGSQQMALEGHNSVAILKHYYPGATLVRIY